MTMKTTIFVFTILALTLSGGMIYLLSVHSEHIFINWAITAILIASLAYLFADHIESKLKNNLKSIEEKLMAGSTGSDKLEIKPKIDKEFKDLSESIETFLSGYENKSVFNQKKHEDFLSIMDAASIGIVAVDIYSDIILANRAAKELFKISGQVEGKYFLEVFFDSRLDRAVQYAIRTQEKSVIDIFTKLNEPKILNIEISPLTVAEEKHGVVMFFQDVTELKRLEQIRTDFAANVSHELRTPLTSIKGFVETLLEGALKDEQTALKFLGIIKLETDRLYRLINDILSLSDIENKRIVLTAKRVNLKEVLLETIDMMKSHADAKDIFIVFSAPEADVYISINTDRFKQMIINLLDNAIKYTPDGGRVDLVLQSIQNEVIVKIKDNGIGIAKEHIPRIFERFYRIDKGRTRSLGGTGLGLAIVKHIARTMGGNIEVFSEVAKGSEFVIRLPNKKNA